MTRAPQLEALIGTTLADNYRLTSLVGAGGMGYVYRAEHIPLGRVVAVKLLKPQLLDAGEDWFRSEALAASRINHPHAVSVFDVGLTQQGVPFMVMEYLRGETLSALIEAAPLSTARAVTIAAQILSALAEAHDCGVVHCDLSADNIIVEQFRTGEDFAKVIDFGLSRLVDASGRASGLVGTPEYMAPEQLRGEVIGPGADLYAVGVLLYEMLVGRTPFDGSSVRVILDGHLHALPVAPHELGAACPPDLSALALWALAKHPDDRPRGAREMRDALLSLFTAERAAPPCPVCSERATWGDRLCNRCGAPLNEAPRATPRPLARGSAPDHHRRSSRISAELEHPATGAPLVGREAELARVVAFCRGDTHDHAMSIVGPRGSGKGRLMCEAARALGRQVPFFVSGPDPSGAHTPWYPILAVLERMLDLPEVVTLEALTDAVAHIGLPDRDVPGLAELFAIEGPARALEHAVRRREAQASALRALLSIRRRYPRAVLGFADVDQYDQPSRRLVSALISGAPGGGVRVLLSAERSAELPADLATVELSPLSPEATGALARQLTGDRGSVPDDEALHEMTGGLPEAVEQLVGWLELGNRAAGAPTILVDLVSSRISRMPAGSRRVLQATAVHGTSVPRWIVDATLDDHEALTATGHGFTGLVSVTDDQVTLSSELVREVILACTPADVRRNLHRRALAALDGKVNRGAVGYHAERIGDYDRAYTAYVDAARDAIERFDDRGGAMWYGRARDVARTAASLGDNRAAEKFVEAALALADVLRFTGQVGLAAGALDEAELFATRRYQHARLVGARGRVAVSGNDFHEGIDLLRLAVGAAVRLGDRNLMCASYIDLARSLERAGRSREARIELQQALDMLTMGAGLPSADAPGDLWYLGLLLAERLNDAGEHREALAIAERALEQARVDDSARGRARLSALLARISEHVGDGAAALRHRANALEHMRTLGDRRSTAELLIDNASTSRELGAPALAMVGDLPDSPRRSLRIAGRLAREIGWQDGIMLSREASKHEDEAS